MEPMDLIWIQWMDSASADGWHREEDLEREPLVCESVGWLVLENDKMRVLAGSISDSDQFAVLMYIPNVSVLKIKRLTKGRNIG